MNFSGLPFQEKNRLRNDYNADPVGILHLSSPQHRVRNTNVQPWKSLSLVCLLFALGCDKNPAGAQLDAGAEPVADADPVASADPVIGAEPGERDSKIPPQATSEESTAAAVTSLWTRKAGEDWPIFLGPTRDNKSSETGILTDWSGGKLKILWQRELGTSYGIGTISRGRYFQFDRYDDKARLYCLQAETGKELWRFEYPTRYRDLLGYNNGPRCSPILDGNRVYILGVEGMLHCVQAADGELVWQVDTNKKYGVVQNFFGVGSTPAIEGDLLICMIGGSPPGSPELYESGGRVKGNGSGIVAFDKYTGKVKYEITDELASYASMQLATIGKRRWGFAFCRGGLIGFEPNSGNVDFHYPWRSTLLESVNASTPVVVDDHVFISETYQVGSSLLRVAEGDYDVVWKDSRTIRAKAMLTHWNTPIHLNGYLYGCSGRNSPDADLRCIHWKTGQVKWIEQEAEVRERSSLLYVDGHFIYLGELGTMRLIKANPQKYELVSELILRREGEEPDAIDGGQPRLLRYPCWAAPVLSHGLLYVRGDDRLVCLDLIPPKS